MAYVPFRPLNGLLLLDKSRGISSNKTLQDVRFTYRAKKAGHTGTLDPFATGLLPVCFGEANKYARWLFDANKTYDFTAVLGQYSTTGDTEGDITIIDTQPTVTDEQLRDTEVAFLGEITQIPPKYSAIKINGQRAYELARKGEPIEIPSRQVTIHSLSLSVEGNIMTGSASVSKGTYIRTLVEDVAVKLGTVAYCQELRRQQIANLINVVARPMHTFSDIESIEIESLRDELLLPIDLLCEQFPIQNIDDSQWELLIQGRAMPISSEQQGIVRLYLNQVFLGLGNINDNTLKAFRLLNTGFS